MPVTVERDIKMVLSGAELDLLRRFEAPCSEAVLSGARRDGEGFLLTGSWADFDALAGWVASEANHARSDQRVAETDLLDRIADEIEDVLAFHFR